MLFDPIKYDDKNDKPFKSDFDMLGDMLISLVTGSDTFKLKDPKNTFHIYAQILKYYEKKHFPVGLKTPHLNMPNRFLSTPKMVTVSELEWLLRDSFFNFVYKLKSTGAKDPNRFVEISQALKHGFLITKNKSQAWDAHPADY